MSGIDGGAQVAKNDYRLRRRRRPRVDERRSERRRAVDGSADSVQQDRRGGGGPGASQGVRLHRGGPGRGLGYRCFGALGGLLLVAAGLARRRRANADGT